MEMPGARRIHAAVVVVRGDVFALALARHHAGAGIGVLVVGLDLAREVVVVARRPGADEAAVPVQAALDLLARDDVLEQDRKSTRLNSSHLGISYAVFCLKKKNTLKK